MRIKISESVRKQIIQRAHNRCEYCLVHENDFFLSGEIDHIISLKHGGTNHLDNLAFSCIHCNRNKGTDVATLIKGIPIRLYNPRIDIWNEHFSLSGPIILANTDIGLATLNLLQINHEYRVVERTIFIHQRSYPPTL